MDESPDSEFYGVPRLATHIDDATIAALSDVYRERMPPGGTLLDFMSSWVSHLPDGPSNPSGQLQLLAECPVREHHGLPCIEVSVAEMHLEKARDRRSRGEVQDGRAHGALTTLALDPEQRLSVLQHDEVELAFVGVAEEA